MISSGIEQIIDRFISTAHMFHLQHDRIHRIDECDNHTCKMNVSCMKYYHLHIPQ